MASSTGPSATASLIAACGGGAGASTSAAVAGITGTAAAASSSSVATILGVGAAAVGFGLRVLSTISIAKLDVDVEIIRTTVADCHANTPLRAIPKESLVEFFVRTVLVPRNLAKPAQCRVHKHLRAAPLCHRSAVKEPHCPPALLSGLQLGSSMPTFLGHGHFGKVYRGQLLNGCTVAIKVTSLGPQPGLEAQCQVALAARENIVQLYGLFVADSRVLQRRRFVWPAFWRAQLGQHGSATHAGLGLHARYGYDPQRHQTAEYHVAPNFRYPTAEGC